MVSANYASNNWPQGITMQPDIVASGPKFSMLVTKTQKELAKLATKTISCILKFVLYVVCNQIKLQIDGSETQVASQVRSMAFSHVLRG